MTLNSEELKALVERLERRNDRRRMGVALLGAVVILGGVTFVTWHPYAQKPIVAVVPAPVPAKPVTNAYADLSLRGKAAIVYDLKTHQTLYERNAHAQLPLASLTKLLTMYAAATTLSPNSTVAIGTVSLNDAGDVGFTTGETFTFEDLARLALVASSNVAAEAIAQTAQDKRAMSTGNLLAGAAAAAGLSQTYAVNASGLDESTTESGGYGSAYDVAQLSGALLEKAPIIAHATIEPSISIKSLDGITHTLPNTNPDVVHIPNILLSKTGYTDLAGGNLVVVFDAGLGHPVAVVVLGSTESGRFNDVQQLISDTLQHFADTAVASTATSTSPS